jgi:hypothetical protein
MGIKTKVMKKGETYKTPEGKTEKVLMVDEENKMVHVKTEGSTDRWVHEPEYSTWTSSTTAEMPMIYIPDIPAQMIDEPVKKTRKKKDDTILN